MTIRRALISGVSMAAISAVGASVAAAEPCEPARPGVPRTLLERVPIVMSAQMAATRDGGAVIAFSSYDGTPEFPDANFTVLTLDHSRSRHRRGRGSGGHASLLTRSSTTARTSSWPG